MKNITDAEKKLYDEQFNMRDILLTFDEGFTVDSSMIASESMAFEEMICENSSLKFGSCNASSFSIEIKDTEHEYKGKRFKAEMITEGMHRAIGYFTVAIDNKTDNKLRRKITAYDAIYSVKDKDVSDWYLGLTFPMTLKAFRDSFFKYLGITQVDVTLANDTMTVEKTVEPSTMKALTVMEAICEVNACFGHINSDGKFEYINLFNKVGKVFPQVTLYPGTDFYPDGSAHEIDYKLSSLKYEDYKCKAITQVKIRQETNDVGCAVGEDGNTYVIQGNFLCYGKSNEELRNIATNFIEVAVFYDYTPASLTAKGKPYLELGDFIEATALNGDRVLFPILHRTMSGIIALMDKYEAKGTETFEVSKGSIQDQIEQIKGKSNVLNRTVEETKSEIQSIDSDIKNNYSTTTDTKSLIDASAKDIKLEITDETDKKLQDYYTSEQTDTQINLSKDGIMQSVEQKIDALGSIYPSEDLYPASDLLPTDGYVSNAELSTSIAISEESITNRVEKRIEGERRDIDESYSEFVQKADRMDWLVSGGESESDMILTDSFIALIAKDLNISGKVTFSAFDSELKNKINTIDSNATNAQSSADAISDNIYTTGKTTIDGGKITADSITADQIASRTITADLLATDAVKSQNYEKGVSGAFLNLKDGSFDSKYTKWDSTGKFEAVSGKFTNAEITNATIKGGKVDIQTSDKSYDQIKLSWLNQGGSISASTIINPGQITVKGEGALNQSVGIEGNRIVITNDDTGNSAIYSADIASVGLVNISTEKILISNGGVSGGAALSCDAFVISDGSSSMSYADGTLWASTIQAGNGWTGWYYYTGGGHKTTVNVSCGIITSVTTESI